MTKCFNCKEELSDEKYRNHYNTIRECKCGALNSVENQNGNNKE